jgi:glycosyltransferase involved in cell wall biosynthesis
MSPLVSVVVPALNAGPWIDAALASVAAQTWPRDALEVLVVDDGSSDDTAQVAGRSLQRDGLRHDVLRRDVTGGPAAARNDGWRRAAGDWVQMLDADDLLEPDKLARQLAGADVPDDVAVLSSPWSSLIERDGAWQPDGVTVDPRMGDDPLMSLLRADNFMATGSQLFRRTWLEAVAGYDERQGLVEDVNLLLRLVMAGGRIGHVPSPSPLFWYRRRANSLSSSDVRDFVEARLRNARLAESHWRQAGSLTPARRVFLAEVYASAIRRWTVDDPAAFDRVAGHIEALAPAFVPSEPEGVRQLARLVGYRRAERAAGRYRQVKAMVKRVP